MSWRSGVGWDTIRIVKIARGLVYPVEPSARRGCRARPGAGRAATRRAGVAGGDRGAGWCRSSPRWWGRSTARRHRRRPAYVETGQRVEMGQVVCIVEAMKLMNEIESEVAGTIARILVENGQPVEFNQPLFLVKPD